LTDIGANGKWQTNTHRGFQYAALLVKKTYKAKARISLLPKVGGDVVAVDRKPGPDQPDEDVDERLPIAITQVPPINPGGPTRTFPIAGRVRGMNTAAYKVVIYAYAGGVWWVQPRADAPLTDIEHDGRWQTETHGGSQYAALLVKKTYKTKATTRTLPKIEGNVVAVDRKPDSGLAIRIVVVRHDVPTADNRVHRIFVHAGYSQK